MIKKIFVVTILLFSSLLLSGCGLKKSATKMGGTSGANPTPTPTKPIEQTIKERPFVSLLPSADSHWLTLEIKKIIEGTSSLEYELIYFAEVEGNRIERGVSTAGSPVELASQAEFSKKILLGSASCTTGTCKYKYDEGVNEGTMTLTLSGASGKEKYESVFRIQKGKEGKEGLTTGDGVFSFVSTNFPATSVYLTISSVGVPSSLPSGVVPKTVPYGIFSSGAIKGGTVTFKTVLTTTSIYAFDGKAWSKLTTEISNGEAKATSSGQNIFILAE